MVIDIGLELLQCPLTNPRSGWLVQASTLGARATASHETPIVHAV